MNSSLTGLIEGMRRALREDIRPELATDYARSQVAGILDILGKLERMLAWSPDALRERLGILKAGGAAIAARAAAAGYTAPPDPSPVRSEALRHADLEHAVRAAEQRLVALTDWLFDSPAALPGDLHSELDALLRSTLRDALVVERRFVSRADFSSMTGTNQ